MSLTLTAPPRGLVHVERPWPLILHALVMSVTGATAVVYFADLLFAHWVSIFNTLSSWFEQEAVLRLAATDTFLKEPASRFMPTLPDDSTQFQYAIGIATAAALFALSFVVDKANAPGRYFLRILTFFIGLPCLGAIFFPEAYVAHSEAHLEHVVSSGYYMLMLSPIILSATGLMLPGNRLIKSALLVLGMGYIAVTVPVLALAHYIALQYVGDGWVPALNIFGNTLLMALQVIVFYSLIGSVR